jgi:hypothetical protein
MSVRTSRRSDSSGVLGGEGVMACVPAGHLVLAPDWGMKYLPCDVASGKLPAMMQAARLRAELGRELPG